MNLYKNFLSKNDFDNLETFIMNDYMPWYYNDGLIVVPDEYFQFTFMFVKDQKINCTEKSMNILQPVLAKIKYKTLNRIKANLTVKQNKHIEYEMHMDQQKGTTGILYINDNNGYTKFKDGTKIKSEKNTYIEFDSKTKHTGASCTDEKRRVVINFNYNL